MALHKYACALLVDDDPISIWIQKQVMMDYQDQITHTHEASNGEEALEFIMQYCESGVVNISTFCPDLVLLDLNMPVMDGFQFLEALKNLELKRKNEIRIVVVTSSNNPKDIERLKDYNIFKFLNKPLTPEKVHEILAA